MEAWVIAFLFAIGGATWVYSKMMRTTGNNTGAVMVVAGLAFAFIFLIAWSALTLFL